MTYRQQPEKLDLIWGAKAIGEALGLSEGQAKFALVKGEIPGRKVNGRWVVSRHKLVEHFEDRAA